ncbi:MAG TPA: ribosomal protein S18-alanine N-acetyltransferase [Clostridiaceae bacterium]
MIDLAIRSMEIRDINSVIKINSLSFPTNWSRESLEKEMLDNKFARYKVALVDGMIIGYAGMWIIVDEAHITNIAVHPEYRGIGVGANLLDSLIKTCEHEKVPSITLEVRSSNKTARRLYEKFGFLQEGIRKAYYADNKEDAIIMWKKDIC